MKILTLETTCDETAAAVITGDFEVLASVVASQDKLHQRFHGVVPEIAARAHVERILPVIDETVRQAGIRLDELDAIAVANTPGLAGSLLVGLVAAKTLCVALDRPLVAVNHLHAHIYACKLDCSNANKRKFCKSAWIENCNWNGFAFAGSFSACFYPLSVKY